MWTVNHVVISNYLFWLYVSNALSLTSILLCNAPSIKMQWHINEEKNGNGNGNSQSAQIFSKNTTWDPVLVEDCVCFGIHRMMKLFPCFLTICLQSQISWWEKFPSWLFRLTDLCLFLQAFEISGLLNGIFKEDVGYLSFDTNR